MAVRRGGGVVAVTVLATMLAAASPAGSQAVGDRPVPPGPAVVRDKVDDNLAGRLAVPDGIRRTDDGAVVVEILHHGDDAAVAAAVVAAGGSVVGSTPGWITEAAVPVARLGQVADEAAVNGIRPPLDANVTVIGAATVEAAAPSTAGGGGATTGDHVAAMGLDRWHDAGITGAGVKVGIVDFFDRGAWDRARDQGEVPDPAGTFCRSSGSTCSVWDAASTHGVNVAEVVHDGAPGAELYLATVTTTSDLRAAVDWFATRGVDVVTRSLTSYYDGPGDGTGPLASVQSRAVRAGMAWFNSAGNTAGRDGSNGGYWRAGWVDDDGDGWGEFAPGDELLAHVCRFTNGLRWSDWGSTDPTDYDIVVYDTPSGPVKWSSRLDQTTNDPLEPGDATIGCAIGTDVDYLAVQLVDEGDGTADDTLEFMVNGVLHEHWSNPFSASGPLADTADPGALSVGAVEPAGGVRIAPYSAQGPTNDGRISPTLSAPTCLRTWTVGPGYCFDGTSASTPATAGAAALVLDAGLVSTPAELRTWLIDDGVVDRGAAGADLVFGHGALLLPAPPSTAATCGGRDATLVGTPGDDTLVGTVGADVIVGLGGDDVIDGGGGGDTICAGGGDDTVDGGRGGDTIDGGAGRDRIDGGPGDDRLDGGPGVDRVDHGGDDPVEVDLAAGTSVGQGSDTLVGVENVGGTPGDDVLSGDAADNRLSGGRGDDRLVGRSGDDRLLGQSGDDRLVGRAGDDTLDGGGGDDVCIGGGGVDVDRGDRCETVRSLP